ncbi:MAG: pgsA3 [Chlamydiia bacterium]|nr:pgsA3 [Chlamydiia bacterium]
MNIVKLLPNCLSFLRLPLAALLFIPDPYIRCGAIIAAQITDILDGFLARRLQVSSRFGTLLDPITDKLFVITALIIFFIEKKMAVTELTSFLCRDFSLLLFSGFLVCVGGWNRFVSRAFYCGKIVTSLQFLALLAMSVNIEVPALFFGIMGSIGLLSFIELVTIYYREQHSRMAPTELNE